MKLEHVRGKGHTQCSQCEVWISWCWARPGIPKALIRGPLCPDCWDEWQARMKAGRKKVPLLPSLPGADRFAPG